MEPYVTHNRRSSLIHSNIKNRHSDYTHQVNESEKTVMMVRISSNLGDLMSGNFAKTNEMAIRELLENWAQAVQRKDLDGILAKHSQDIVMFDLPATLQSRGIEAYKKTWDLFFDWYQDSPSFEICEMKITAGNDVA